MTSSKRNKNFTLIDRKKNYSLGEALKIVKSNATTKFDESIDIAINLGIDPRKSDQNVRGSVVLPEGLGKTVRVAVFAQGEDATKATESGADLVGYEELAESIKKGKIEFETLIATPDAMKIVGSLGQILGPKGLMPNPKVGTVTKNVGEAVKNAKAGQVQFRSDKGGILHCSVGRASFSEDALVANIKVFYDAVTKAKPTSSKGQYIKKVSISSTMGVGVRIETSSINA